MRDYFGDLVPVIGVAAVVTLVTTPFFRWLSFRIDAVVKPDERRVHTEPTALLGGAAILLGFLAGFAWAWRGDAFDRGLRRVDGAAGRGPRRRR